MMTRRCVACGNYVLGIDHCCSQQQFYQPRLSQPAIPEQEHGIPYGDHHRQDTFHIDGQPPASMNQTLISPTPDLWSLQNPGNLEFLWQQHSNTYDGAQPYSDDVMVPTLFPNHFQPLRRDLLSTGDMSHDASMRPSPSYVHNNIQQPQDGSRRVSHPMVHNMDRHRLPLHPSRPDLAFSPYAGPPSNVPHVSVTPAIPQQPTEQHVCQDHPISESDPQGTTYQGLAPPFSQASNRPNDKSSPMEHYLSDFEEEYKPGLSPSRSHVKPALAVGHETNNTPIGDTQFRCEECSKVCSDKKALKSHTRKHKEKKIVCEIEGCDQRFHYAKDLKRHMHKHKKERTATYLCPKSDCLYFEIGFPRKDHFKRHLQSHFSELSGAQLNKKVDDCSVEERRRQRIGDQSGPSNGYTVNPNHDVEQQLRGISPTSPAFSDAQASRTPLAPRTNLLGNLQTRASRPSVSGSDSRTPKSSTRRPRRGSSR
ncbi:MAG: hypothetical protein Q9165_005312 [Trypethelium subeluteriae]